MIGVISGKRRTRDFHVLAFTDFDEYAVQYPGGSEIAESPSGARWFPVMDGRLTAFIAGNPGAGKSYLAKELINLLPPSSEILLFTALAAIGLVLVENGPLGLLVEDLYFLE